MKVKLIRSEKLYFSDHGWLKSRFHFSFAEYHNPANMNFGTLRVLNDDLVMAKTGFDTHPHRDMEIISYCVKGELSHGDSMQNREVISRGHVQYMSAGTGIRHYEYNLNETEELRFIQMWILPEKTGLPPVYGSARFQPEARTNRILEVAGKTGAEITLRQNAEIRVTEFDREHPQNFLLPGDRKMYLVCLEGELNLFDETLRERDAMEIIPEPGTEESIHFITPSRAHLLFITVENR